MKSHKVDVNTGEKETAELHCNFHSVPAGKVQWLREGRTLHADKKYQMRIHEIEDLHLHHKHNHTKSTLIINDVNKGDLGRYECQVTNKWGTSGLNISLIYEPEQAVFKNYEFELDNKQVLTNWTVQSIQPISEVVLSYKKQGDHIWNQVKPMTVTGTENPGEWM